MTWTQPVCDNCWDKDHENEPEFRSRRTGRGDVETCCKCGRLTISGLYDRIDPATVPYPRTAQNARWRES